MPAAFDPYHRWLGIPPKDQPPNHYRLLGLELFENDPAVIESAADRQMVHVRSFQSGPYSVLSQRILNEIAAAKVTLLNVEKKAAYDSFLWAKLAAAGTVPQASGQSGEYGENGQSTYPPHGQGAVDVSAAQGPIPLAVPIDPALASPERSTLPESAFAAGSPEAAEQAVSFPVATGRRAVCRSRSRSSGTMLAVSLLAGSVLIAGILYLAASRGGGNGGQLPDEPSAVGKVYTKKPLDANGGQPRVVAAQTDVATSKTQDSAGTSKTQDNGDVQDVQAEPSATAKPGPEGSDKTKVGAEEPPGQGSQMEVPGSKPEEPGQQPSEAPPTTEPSQPATNPPVAGTEMPGTGAEPSGKGAPSEGAAQPAEKPTASGDEPPMAKSGTPGQEAVDKALAELKTTFAKEYAQANTPEGKVSLAKLLLVEAEQTSGDAMVRYVMLRQAAQLAAEAGDYLVCREAVLKLESRSSGDPWPLRIETLSELSRTVRNPNDRAVVVTGALQLVDVALRADNYEAAEKLASIAVAAASKGADLSLRKLAIEQREAVRVAIKAWEEVQPAAAKLASDPHDPEANLIVGRYRAFVRRDWTAGLPLLAKGSEARLKTIAQADQANPASPDEQVKLADLWWEYGETQSGAAHAAARSRATHWYVQAEPHLQGLAKTRTERRLREAGAVVDLLAIFQPKRAAYVGNWHYDGKVLSSPGEPFARLQFPFTPPEAYELTIIAERRSNPRQLGFRPESVFAIGLPTAAGQVVALIDVAANDPSAPPGPPGQRRPGRPRGEDIIRDFARNFFQQRVSGLASPTDDGLTLASRNEHPRALDSDRENTIVATVRPSGVSVSVNGATVVSYSGDLKKLGVPRAWAMPDPKRIFVGSHGGIFRILKVEVRPLPP